jgi:hypothetical protein
MTTEQQLAANRANAQKSTGPKTPGGKYISSRNGTRDGSFAESIILPGESAERFRKLHASYIDQFQPATVYERDLVETMTVNRWRLRRVWELETASFGHEQRAQSFATQGEDPPTKYVLAHRALSQPPRSLESLNRYEVRCDRQYNRAADRLRRILAEREKMPIRSQIPEQNQPLNQNDPPNRTGVEPRVEPGGEPGSNQEAKPEGVTIEDVISTESRQLLGDLRNLLLEQHKLLLDREKASYEKTSGPIAGPGQFLTLVLGDPHFAWLKQISSLVVDIDESLAPRSKAEQPEAEALIAKARELMRPREQGTDFQTRYYAAIQESPDIVILQVRIERLLGI